MPVDPIPGRSAAEIIRLLDLRPHPEGGLFRETFRDPACDARGRAVSTLIYFLLDAGQVSRWHKVDFTGSCGGSGLSWGNSSGISSRFSGIGSGLLLDQHFSHCGTPKKVRLCFASPSF
jgi:cupin superfamily protein DUF985